MEYNIWGTTVSQYILVHEPNWVLATKTSHRPEWRTYGIRKDFLGTHHSLLSHFFYFFWPTSNSILWRICVYIHISDCVDTVYKLPLLPNSTANETFLHNSGVEWSVDWIFIIRAPDWRSVGEVVTLNKILVDNQLDGQFLLWYVYLNSRHASSNYLVCAHPQEDNCINTSSGIITLKINEWSKIIKF